MRGALIGEVLAAAGHQVTLGITPGAERHLHTALPLRFESPCQQPGIDALVVDTFPQGFTGDLDAASLTRFRTRVLVARYRRDAVRDEHTAYHRVWAPYPRELDEWPTPLADAVYTGWLARPTPVAVESTDPDWVILDTGKRIGAPLRAVFERLAERVQRPLRWVYDLDVPLRAGKLLVVGAGYATVYELGRAAIDLRFMPLQRRWDDQHRRVRRLDRAVESLDALQAWLRRPSTPRALPSLYLRPSLLELPRCNDSHRRLAS